MDRFEFVFSLIGLVLGLSLVEVIGGLAKTFKARTSVKVGWLTPMLGLWVIAHVTSYWGVFWAIRDILPNIWHTLGAGVLITGGYYLAASMVFPNEPEQEETLDDHYWKHKRQVIGIILVCTLAFQLFGLALGRVWSPVDAALNISVFATQLFTLLVKGPRLNVAGLTVLLVLMASIFIIP